MRSWRLVVPLLCAVSAMGCATKVAEFRDPKTGMVGRCFPNPEAVMGGALGMMSEGNRYADCKTDFERRGFVRTPEGRESDETKEIVRKMDDARAASIRKPGSPVPEDKSRVQPITTAVAPTPNPPPQQQAPTSSVPNVAAAVPKPQPLPIRPEPNTDSTSPVASQSSKVSTPPWFLGSWKTVSGRSGSVDGVGSFEFWQENGDVKWRMVRSGWFSGAQTTQRASGTVLKSSSSAVELMGRYDSSNFGNVVGQPVRHVLSRDGDRLSGYETLLPDGARAALSLERVN